MTRLGFCLLYTPDVTAKIELYERAFAMERKFIAEGGSFGELAGDAPLCFADEKLAAAHVGEIATARPGATPAAVEVGFIVDDVEAAYARAIAAGAAPHRPPAKTPWGQTVAYVRDPDGVLVELCTAWST